MKTIPRKFHMAKAAATLCFCLMLLVSLATFTMADDELKAGGAGQPENGLVSDDDDTKGGGDEAEFTRYDALIASLTIFVVAIFVGFEVITKVPPTLHTPLMSGSNAISGITIVGAILATGYSGSYFVAFVGMVALALATVNVVGGFLVTHRMLEMFRKKN